MDYMTDYTFSELQPTGRVRENLVRVVAREDQSQPYEMDCMSIFELDNGKFITVNEQGLLLIRPKHRCSG